jgi:hypothetical protein
LLRAILSPESRIAFLRSLSTDYGASSSRPKENTFLKHLAGLLSRPSRLIPHWQKLHSSTPITLTLYQPPHNPQRSSLVQVSYMVHVEAVLSASRKRAAIPSRIHLLPILQWIGIHAFSNSVSLCPPYASTLSDHSSLVCGIQS